MHRVEHMFDLPKKGAQDIRLREENRKLKTLIGDLTVELKKNQEEAWV